MQVNTCKSGNNTWAYVGDINDKPQLSCVYQSDDAQNEFLSNPKVSERWSSLLCLLVRESIDRMRGGPMHMGMI